MTGTPRILFPMILTMTVVLLSYREAYAYLDPATGSYIFQMIIAGLLGAALAVKMFWQNLKSFFTNLFSKNRDGQSDDK